MLLAEFSGATGRNNTKKLPENQRFGDLGFLAPTKCQLSPEKTEKIKNAETNFRKNSCSVVAKSKDYRISKKQPLAMSTGIQNGANAQFAKVAKSLRWNTLENL